MTTRRASHPRLGGSAPLVTAAALGALALVGSVCSSPASSPSTTSTAVTATSTSIASTTISGTAVGSTTTAASATSTSAVENLQATTQIKADLREAFVAMKQFPASDVAGLVPGSVYCAYDPSMTTYWALADFMPSLSAPEQVLVSFQDGGDEGLYSMPSGSA